MTQETTTVAVKGPADSGAMLALEKIRALHLQVHIGLLAGMQIIRTEPQNDDVIALVNHWAGISSLLGEAERDLVRHLGTAQPTNLH